MGVEPGIVTNPYFYVYLLKLFILHNCSVIKLPMQLTNSIVTAYCKMTVMYEIVRINPTISAGGSCRSITTLPTTAATASHYFS